MLIGQSFPIVERLSLAHWEVAEDGSDYYEKKYLEKMDLRQDQLFQAQKDLVRDGEISAVKEELL